MSRLESAKRLGAIVETCCFCSAEFIRTENALFVETTQTATRQGAGYACSVECAKAKVDSLGDAYVWVDGKIGGDPLYEKIAGKVVERPGLPTFAPTAAEATVEEKTDAHRAVERLGVKLYKCPVCLERWAWDPDETFSVMPAPSGKFLTARDPDEHDANDDGIRFCCSHACASRLAHQMGGHGLVWRGGKCGGTLMPMLEEA
jgi:hypothetical protein